jgi:hypothetical protein
MNYRTITLASLVLSLAGCDIQTEQAEPQAAEQEEATPPPAQAEPEDPEPAPEPEPAQAPAADGAITVQALRAGFTADQAGWLGREVTVSGLFLSATSVGGTVNNISLLESRDANMMESVLCTFGPNPPASITMTQWTQVTVRGRVREFFRRPALENCSIVEN